jgi:hypothetical protein
VPCRSCALGPTDARPPRIAISLLKSYSAYYIKNYYTAAGLAPPAEADDADEDEPMDGAQRKVGEPDLILGAAFGIDDVRSAREEILALAGPNIAEVRAGAGRGATQAGADLCDLLQSQHVWLLWKSLEVDLTRVCFRSRTMGHC